MVVPSLDYYWPQVISGARAEAEEQNLRILVRGSAYDAADNRRQVQALLDTQNIDGLIVAPDMSGEHGQELLRWLNALPIPVVLTERRSPAEIPAHRLEWVATDHAFGAGHGRPPSVAGRPPHDRLPHRLHQPHQPARGARLAAGHGGPENPGRKIRP